MTPPTLKLVAGPAGPRPGRSGRRHLLELSGQARDLPRAGVLVHHALADGAHQLGLSLYEGVLGGAGVARGHSLFELAQEGAHARTTGGVDFGAAGDLADRLLGAGRVGHSELLSKRVAPAGWPAGGIGGAGILKKAGRGKGASGAPPPGL